MEGKGSDVINEDFDIRDFSIVDVKCSACGRNVIPQLIDGEILLSCPQCNRPTIIGEEVFDEINSMVRKLKSH
jgi:DNA-directed RNA polymerase subunit RPC12/RpoP